MLLNLVFLVHAALALGVAVALLLVPEWFTAIATGASLDGEALAALVKAYARLAALGPIAISLVAGLARHSASPRVRWTSLVSLLATAAGTAAIACAIPFRPLAPVAVAAGAALAATYLYVLVFESDEI